MNNRPAGPDGVLIVDKPEGPTSHDVVGKVRRALATRKVGHAGTLDPLASGVLVVLVGEATKLGPYLTAHEKCYRARVVFGVATDTLDRAGAPTQTAEVPGWLRDELSAITTGGASPRLTAALAMEHARGMQTPPAYSAIKVGGQRSYSRARAGESVALADRPVEVKSLTVIAGGATETHPWLDIDLAVSKGYYVRSFALDLGAGLGLPSHLGALRRLSSGPFDLDRAIALADATPAGLLSVEAAARLALPVGVLSDEGAVRARQGKTLTASDFVELPQGGVPSAWLDRNEHLVAVGTRTDEAFELHRGFGRIADAAVIEEPAPPPPPPPPEETL